MDENGLSHEIIGAAIEVHKALGPGLLESVYETALAHELVLRGLAVKRQLSVPVSYKEHRLEAGFRMDILVADLVIVEIKAVEKVLPIHEMQLLTYLKLAGKRLGLLLNFSATGMTRGIKRIVNNL